MENLLPCPFCGGVPKMTRRDANQITIQCQSCRVKITQKVLRYSIEWLEEKTVTRWNTRTAAQQGGQPPIHVYEESEVEEVAVGEYRLKNRAPRPLCPECETELHVATALREHVAWAAELIQAAAELMTTEQVGCWRGVRAWLEDDLTPEPGDPATEHNATTRR